MDGPIQVAPGLERISESAEGFQESSINHKLGSPTDGQLALRRDRLSLLTMG